MHRAIPLYVDSWGIIGEYLRQMTVHPAMRTRFAREISKSALDWTDPMLAIPLLDELAGVSALAGGDFRCSTMFWLGLSLGQLGSCCLSLKECPDSAQLHASLLWAEIELIKYLRELRERWGSVARPSKALPVFVLRGPEKAAQMLPEIDSLATWIVNDFLGPDHLVHRQFFSLGFESLPLVHPQFGGSSTAGTKARTRATDFSRTFIADQLDCFLEEGASPDFQRQFLAMFAQLYLGLPSISLDVCRKQLRTLDDEDFLRDFPDNLLQLADYSVYAVFHETSGLNLRQCDWEWIKRQILKLRRQATGIPAVVVRVDGTVGTQLLPQNDPLIPDIGEDENRVVLLVQFGGDANLVEVVTWEQLRSGEPWKDLL